MEIINRKIMRKLIFLIAVVLFSCKDARPVNAPKNLVEEGKMSSLIADFAINEQLGMINPNGNLDTNSRYILKRHGVSAKEFSESYHYYLSSPETIREILDDAQEIIKKQDPEAEKFIDKKLKEVSKGVPAFAR